MPDVEFIPEGGPAEKGDHQEARQFILKVKKTIERCLEQRMNKAEMFRVIREEGLPTWIAFAVFKELREQNHDFFREYYSMHDLKEQREKLGRLIQAYRAGGSAATTGARAPEAAPTAAAVMGTDAAASMEWSRQQTEEDAWLDGELARLLARSSTGGGVEFAGAALPHQQAVHCPGGQQQPHDDQQAVYNDRLREMGWAEEAEAVAAPTLAQQQLQNEQPVANGLFQGEQLMVNNGGFQGAPAPTLAAGLPSDILMDPWPLSQDGIVGWGQEQQAEPLGQRWPGAGADPSSPSFTLPGGEQLGNQNFYGGSNGGRVQ
ncbi:uncharacterized protein C2845_PM16G16000 [Panicum miliaceum]|uniref:Uncharacterized protein n=1 Tax=Panicum miliaceum TaxID=4540 RepID=A0A3L6PUM5_PANMI|nr:uncharacterized protein C2845_PM16G16000 [Panicum miliaceum]